MTILVKTNIGAQKQPADVVVMPLINIDAPEPPVNGAPKPPAATAPTRARKSVAAKRSLQLKFLLLLAAPLLLLGFLLGLLMFTEFVDKYSNRNVRYRGSCAISTTQDMDYVVVREAPTTASWFGAPSAEMKVYSTASDLINAKILHSLLEDMAIEDEVESIYVHDGSRSFRVVHDFNENYTSIISPQRCFLMDMIRQFVLEPNNLIASFRNDSSLELSHAHTVFRAELPDVSVSMVAQGMRYPAVTQPCVADSKPIYRLKLEGTHVLHKRSVEVRTTLLLTTVTPSTEPPTDAELPNNDFVQFSGKHLQRITVSNLDDVIKYEQDNNALQAHPKVRAGMTSDE